MEWDKMCAKLEMWFLEMKVETVTMQGRNAKKKSWKWKKKHTNEKATRPRDMN
jgi:hypothetical protein